VRFAELYAPIWEARAADLAAPLEGP
jgi:hypothetical protein